MLPTSVPLRVGFYLFLSCYLGFVGYLVIGPSGVRNMQRSFASLEVESPVPASWTTRYFGGKPRPDESLRHTAGMNGSSSANGASSEPLLNAN
eukprot:scaffold579696_cov45-Prasinocladus_malaysianus.AAC.1